MYIDMCIDLVIFQDYFKIILKYTLKINVYF
jgi:hypothetical protein